MFEFVLPVLIQPVVLTPQIKTEGVVAFVPLNIKIWSPDVAKPLNALDAVPLPDGVTFVVEPLGLEKVITVPAGMALVGVVQVTVFSVPDNGPLAEVHALSVK